MTNSISNCCNAKIKIKDVGEDGDPIRELFCSKCGKVCDFHLANTSPCCNEKMRQVPDNIHFHYQCVRCCNEFELDGKTKWSLTTPKKERRK